MREAIQASALEAKPVEWLWRERIPKGMITIVAGRPDQGKGLFAAHLAAEVSREGKNVLYSAAEDDPSRMTRPRLEAAGADLDRVLIWNFRLPLMGDALYDRIIENEASLVVMDPFASHLSGGVSRHSDNVRTVTDPLAEVAHETGCAFLIVEHALKRIPKNADPLTLIGGSGSGLSAAARAAYMLAADPKDGERRLLCQLKLNIAERRKSLAFETDVAELDNVDAVPFLLFQEETEMDAATVLAMLADSDGVPGRPPDKRAAAAEWLTRLLFDAGKAVKAGDVLEDGKHYGLSSKTIRRAADDMGIIKKPPGGGRNCTWELPPEVLAALSDDGVSPDGSDGGAA
jgi:hypothetical protein